MISCANKILSRPNNILSHRHKLKNKTRMSLPGFRIKCLSFITGYLCAGRNLKKKKKKNTANRVEQNKTSDVHLQQNVCFSKTGWSGGAMVMGKLQVPGRPTSLDESRTSAYNVVRLQ